MAKLPRTMIALPVRWTGAFNATVSDDVGAGRTVAVISGALWTRVFLAPSTGGTSETAPTDLLRHVEAQLNAGGGSWAVTLRDTGRVRIAYNGSGTGSITWGASSAVRNALGITGNLSLPSGTYEDGDYLPAHCWYPYSLDNDSGFRAEHSLAVGAMLSSGQVVAYDEGVQLVDRAFRVRFAPASETVRSAKGWYSHPYWPPEDATTRRTAPTIASASTPVAWTVHETLSCALGLRVAYVIANLQDLIAATSSRYYVGAFGPDPLRSKTDRAALTIPAYTSLVDVPAQTLTLTTTETR